MIAKEPKQRRATRTTGYLDPDDQPGLDQVQRMTRCRCDRGPLPTEVEVGEDIIVGVKEVVVRRERICMRCGRGC